MCAIIQDCVVLFILMYVSEPGFNLLQINPEMLLPSLKNENHQRILQAKTCVAVAFISGKGEVSLDGLCFAQVMEHS